MDEKRALILAGGESRRFGSDKSAIQYKGKLLIEYPIDALRSCGFSITILSGRKPHLEGLGLPILEDTASFQGPLCAIHGAMTRLSAGRFLVVACDMPFITAGVCNMLWEKSGDVVHIEGSPLPGVYSSTVLPEMKTLLSDGKRGMFDLLHSLDQRRVTAVSKDDIGTADPGHMSLVNINEPGHI